MTASGAAHTIASTLADLGEGALCGLLLETLTAEGDGASRRAAAEEVMSEAAVVGRRIPGDPWVCRSAIMDDQAYALWVLDAGDKGFCVVADFGPVVMTGSGRDIDTWDWTFTAIPEDDAAHLLAAFSPEAE